MQFSKVTGIIEHSLNSCDDRFHIGDISQSYVIEYVSLDTLLQLYHIHTPTQIEDIIYVLISGASSAESYH